MSLCVSTRLSAGYFLRWIDRLREDFAGDVQLGLVFVGLVQGNIGHLDRDRELTARYSDIETPPPDALRRPMRMLALAESLGLPRESVRRRVQFLAKSRVAVRQADGFIVPASVLQSEVNVASLHSHEAALRAMIEALAKAGEGGLSAGERLHAQPRHRLLARLGSDYCLRALADLIGAFRGEVLAGLVFLALALVTTDAADAEPRAISVQALAAAIGLPRETVRRHTQRLVERGLARTGPGGVSPLREPLSDPALLEAAKSNEVHLRWLLGQLRRTGMIEGK